MLRVKLESSSDPWTEAGTAEPWNGPPALNNKLKETGGVLVLAEPNPHHPIRGAKGPFTRDDFRHPRPPSARSCARCAPAMAHDGDHPEPDFEQRTRDGISERNRRSAGEGEKRHGPGRKTKIQFKQNGN